MKSNRNRIVAEEMLKQFRSEFLNSDQFENILVIQIFPPWIGKYVLIGYSFRKIVAFFVI